MLLTTNLLWELPLQPFFKYKKEHRNNAIPEADPYKHLHHWIIHAKTVPKKSVQEGNGNPRFTMPLLLSLRIVGIIDLPTGFKSKETPMNPKVTDNKKANAATVAPPKDTTPTAAIVLPPKAVPDKKKSARVTSTPTRSSPRRTNALIPIATTRHN
jgi:hypothetical protein